MTGSVLVIALIGWIASGGLQQFPKTQLGKALVDSDDDADTDDVAIVELRSEFDAPRFDSLELTGPDEPAGASPKPFEPIHTCTVNPDGNADYTSIGEALLDAGGQAVHVKLAPGRYEGMIPIRADTIIEGVGHRGEVVLAGQVIVTMTNPGVTAVFHNLMVDQTDGSLSEDTPALSAARGHLMVSHCGVRGRSGVVAIGADARVTVRRCTFATRKLSTGAVNGARALVEECHLSGSAGSIGGSSLTIRRCEFRQSGHSSLEVTHPTDSAGSSAVVEDSKFVGPVAFAVLIAPGCELEMTNCRFRGVSRAAISGGGTLRADRCAFRDCPTAIGLGDPNARGTITDCRFTGGAEGVAVLPDAQVTVTGCWFRDCARTGIAVDGGHVIATDCRCETGGLGAIVKNSAYGVFTNCEFEKNAAGVGLRDAPRIRFRQCRIRGNTRCGVSGAVPGDNRFVDCTFAANPVDFSPE